VKMIDGKTFRCFDDVDHVRRPPTVDTRTAVECFDLDREKAAARAAGGQTARVWLAV